MKSRKLLAKLLLSAGVIAAAVTPAAADHTQSCGDYHLHVNPYFATGDRNNSCTNPNDGSHCYVWFDYGWQVCGQH